MLIVDHFWFLISILKRTIMIFLIHQTSLLMYGFLKRKEKCYAEVSNGSFFQCRKRKLEAYFSQQKIVSMDSTYCLLLSHITTLKNHLWLCITMCHSVELKKKDMNWIITKWQDSKLFSRILYFKRKHLLYNKMFCVAQLDISTEVESKEWNRWGRYGHTTRFWYSYEFSLL